MPEEQKKEKKPPLRTPMGRLSYPTLFEARAAEEGGRKLYSASLVFDREAQKTPQYKELERVAQETMKEFFKGKIPTKAKGPFRTDWEEKGYPEGSTFINCSSKQRPNVVDHRKEPITDPELVENGYYAILSVRAYGYNKKGNCGVSFGLGNVQVVKYGEPFAGGRSRAEDDFDVVESEDGDEGDIF